MTHSTDETNELRKEIADAQKTIAMLRKDIQIWKDIGLTAFNRVVLLERDARAQKDINQQALDRIALLENEGAAAVLKRERDQWRQSWRNCTRRLANAIEHLGLDHTGEEPRADEA